jgi:hypothetical protein
MTVVHASNPSRYVVTIGEELDGTAGLDECTKITHVLMRRVE